MHREFQNYYLHARGETSTIAHRVQNEIFILRLFFYTPSKYSRYKLYLEFFFFWAKIKLLVFLEKKRYYFFLSKTHSVYYSVSRQILKISPCSYIFTFLTSSYPHYYTLTRLCSARTLCALARNFLPQWLLFFRLRLRLPVVSLN